MIIPVTPKVIGEVEIKMTGGRKRRLVVEVTPEVQTLEVYRLRVEDKSTHDGDMILGFRSVKEVRQLGKLLLKSAEELEKAVLDHAKEYYESHAFLVKDEPDPEKKAKALATYRRMAHLDEIESGEY